MNIISSITSSIASSIIAASSTIAAWFKLLTTNPANSSPTQGTTTFTRASAANYFDGAGVLRSAAVDVPRYQDAGLLIEQASTNSVRAANWRTAAGYNAWGGNATSVADQVGIDGVANKAVTITDTDITGIRARAASILTITADTGTHWQSIAVKKNSAAYIPLIQFQIRSGAIITVSARIDTVTGQLSTSTPVSVVVESRGDFWIVKAPVTNNGAGTRMDIIVYPSVRATLNAADDVALTGSCVFDYPQAELNTASATSLMAAGTTRAADICYTANANIPNLTRGAEFVWKGALPDDGGYHTVFRSSPIHTILYRIPTGVVSLWLGGVYLGSAVGIDTAVHTYTLRTNGSNLHELLVDGVVVHTSTRTGLLQPATPMHLGANEWGTHALNGSTQSFAMYSKAFVAWFKLRTTNPSASSPTQGTTSFSRASSGTAVDANGLLVSYAADVPRQQDGGLLIEQGSTNLCRYSEQVDNAAWNKAGASIAPNTSTAPDGTTTADTVAWLAGQFMYQVSSAAGIANETVTISCYVKSAGVATRVIARIDRNGVGQGNSAAYIISSTSWTRIEHVATLDANPVNPVLRLDYVDGDIIVWGAQIEVGSTATSYIKTLAAPVTRAADICYTAAANIPTLANGATFVWKGALPDDGVFHNAFRSSPEHTIIRRRSNGNIEAFIGGPLMGFAAGVDTAVHTYALRTNGSNLHELLVDGVVVITSTTTGLLQPTGRLNIGSGGGSQYLNDSIQSFTMYDTALTDAEIQGLG